MSFLPVTVLGGMLAAGLLALASPCPLQSGAPVAEGAACSLAKPGGEADRAASPLLHGPAVVEVMSHHCPACRTMEPVVAEAERGCDARVVRAFVEDEDGAALSLRHQVVGVPTFLVLDASGAEIDRLVGTQSVASVRGALRRVSSTPCR